MPKRPTKISQVDAVMGRDEMNLAEFPIALLSNREPDDRRPIVYETKFGRLTITGSEGPREDGNGLPTAADSDVLIGLIQLTKQANNFTDRTVNFTRYELLKIIRWPDEGKSYARLVASLNRWVGVKLHYDKSWWDNKKKCRVDAMFHILDDVTTFDRAAQSSLARQGQDDFPFSTFSWNRVFFRSCQAGNLKRLDLDVYFALSSAVTKQLYRFLDKHFYHADRLSFDLRDLAVAHVGLSPNYTMPRIKEKLAPCLRELEEIGFITPAAKEDRYTKVGHGRWEITFKRAAGAIAPPQVEEAPVPIAAELIARNVTPKTAGELAAKFPVEEIQKQVEALDWLVARKDKRASRSPAGYLVKAIKGEYSLPEGFKTKAQLAEEAETKRVAAERAREEARQQEGARVKQAAIEKAEREAVANYLASLTPEQREQLENEAITASGTDGTFFRDSIINGYVKRLLETRRSSETA